MGANIINMGVIGGDLSGITAYRGLFFQSSSPPIPPPSLPAGSRSLLQLACAVEMAVARTFPLELGLFSMGLYRTVIGIIEQYHGIAIYLIATARPDIMADTTVVPA